MDGNYQKFEIHMRRESDEYCLWKNGQNEVFCILETYKEKRSAYFSVTNLLPTTAMKSDGRMEYRFLMLGSHDGEMIHRDFGEFFVNQNGEGSFFQKFSGPAISCYTHCLLVASKEDGTVTIIYQGETPFFVSAHPSDLWRERLSWCKAQEPAKIFSDDMDETHARWYRIPGEWELPPELMPAKTLIKKYSHYVLGLCEDACYVGIPGRFLQREQPCREEGLFLLWQPLRGGEKFFNRREEMTRQEAEEIFGYWITEVDLSSGTLKSV